MHYNWQPFFCSCFLPSLLGNEQLVCGGRIPSRTNLAVRDMNQNKVDVPGLNFFVEYVCPNAANVRRHTVAVPIDQLDTVLQKLQQMEENIIILINKYNLEGQLDSTDPSGVFVGENGEQVVSISSSLPTSIDSDSVSSVVGSISPVVPLASLNISDPGPSSTTTLQSTVTVAEAIATVTGDSDGTNVVANSTAMASGAASSTILTNAAAPSTTTPDSGSAASSARLTDPVASPSNTGSSAQTSSGSGAAPAYTSGSNPGISADSTTGYSFNAQSSKNVAVYFGQTAATGETTLAAQCADPNIDIVILAFVIAISDGGQYPQLNFGAACGGQTAEMPSKAPGLLSCPQLATDITTCQSKYGKKVLLSIGGAGSQISFPTATLASTFATTMWNLFGPPGNVDIGLRPFGAVQLDGFDVDNEDDLSTNWATFATTMRSHYASTKSKPYYLSSAPQCPFPDESDPQPLLLLCDFVWVQFYNNPACQIGAPNNGFTTSLKQWSSALLKSTMAVKPRMYLGAPAFAAAGTTAYAAIGNADGMQAIAHNVEKMGLSNFGGVMFWDGPEGMLNTYKGKDILAWAKAGLNS